MRSHGADHLAADLAAGRLTDQCADRAEAPSVATATRGRTSTVTADPSSLTV
ncbi:MAG TPA: hypothetical protein VFM55_05360 [Micromonosporaceae bacterium]|nr:hypothetical protein [Micromonosporaceae bacterium]